MSRYRLILVVALLVAAVAGAGDSAPTPTLPPPLPPLGPDAPVGPELLEYRIRLGLVTVGEASIEVDGPHDLDGRTVWRIRSTARSHGVLSRLYPVRDRITSWADTLDLRSHRLRKRIREGRYRTEIDLAMDHDAAEGELVQDRRQRTFPAPVGAHDVLSALLRTRADLTTPGDTLLIPVVLEGQGGKMRVISGDPCEVETPAGRFDCLPVWPELGGAGPFRHEGGMRVDITRDRHRWPVKVTVKVPVVGSLVVELVAAHVKKP